MELFCSLQTKDIIMETLQLLLSVAIIHFGIVIVPGPNFLVIVKNSLIHSRHAGVITARGVAIGTVAHVIAGLLGFTALISQSVLLFNAVKWMGTLYFIYVGIQMIRHANLTKTTLAVDNAEKPTFTDGQALRSGLFTMLSNVKSAFYFLFLFTTVLPTTVNVDVQLSLIILIPVISLTWYSILALTFSNNVVRSMYQRAERAMNYFFGGVWIFLGIRLASVTQD